jgi:hypothetical protein
MKICPKCGIRSDNKVFMCGPCWFKASVDEQRAALPMCDVPEVLSIVTVGTCRVTGTTQPPTTTTEKPGGCRKDVSALGWAPAAPMRAFWWITIGMDDQSEPP